MLTSLGLRIWNNSLVLLNSMETPRLRVFFAVRLVCVFIEDVDEVYGRVVPGLLIKFIWHGLLALVFQSLLNN